MTTARRWPTRRISLGPVSSSVVATARSGMATPSRRWTIRPTTSPTSLRDASDARTTTSISRSPSLMRVATSPLTFVRSVCDTDSGVRSSRASCCGSNRTRTSGLPGLGRRGQVGQARDALQPRRGLRRPRAAARRSRRRRARARPGVLNVKNDGRLNVVVQRRVLLEHAADVARCRPPRPTLSLRSRISTSSSPTFSAREPWSAPPRPPPAVEKTVATPGTCFARLRQFGEQPVHRLDRRALGQPDLERELALRPSAGPVRRRAGRPPAIDSAKRHRRRAEHAATGGAARRRSPAGRRGRPPPPGARTPRGPAAGSSRSASASEAAGRAQAAQHGDRRRVEREAPGPGDAARRRRRAARAPARGRASPTASG